MDSISITYYCKNSFIRDIVSRETAETSVRRTTAAVLRRGSSNVGDMKDDLRQTLIRSLKSFFRFCDITNADRDLTTSYSLSMRVSERGKSFN